MLVTAKELLTDAMKGGYAIGAFNVENMEMVMAVLAAAEAKNSPVIMQTTPGTIKFAGVDYYYANVRAAAERSKIPVVMHLDHGDSFARAMEAYRAGYTSIMIDGSKLSLAENIDLTKRVVDACHPGGVFVEGELGKVGGKEDDLDGGDDNPYTDPEEAKIFVEKTGVDCLAIAIGTAHGIYPKGYTPKLQLELLEEIKKIAPVPLVLHGGSNNPDDEIAKACKIGIAKVNISSDIKYAYFKKLDEVYKETGGFVPAKVMGPAIVDTKAVVKNKMELFNSVGKASLYR